MRRREFIAMTVAVAAPFTARAQSTRLIGFMSPSSDAVSYSNGLFSGLQELGYIEGQSIRTVSRWAHGNLEELPRFAQEFIASKVEVLIASLTQAAIAASKATASIPIVMAGVADPVSVGLIASLARPGGNVTGTSSISAEIVGKQIELLKEAGAGIERIALMYNPENVAFQRLQVAQAEQAAREAGLRYSLVEVRSANEIDAVLDRIARDKISALAILGDPLFALHARSISEGVLTRKIVTVSAGRPYAEAGILLNYGPSLFHLHKRAAVYVDKILRGALPADLPVEQPTKFETFINLRTARAIGLALPPTLLARADEVIE